MRNGLVTITAPATMVVRNTPAPETHLGSYINVHVPVYIKAPSSFRDQAATAFPCGIYIEVRLITTCIVVPAI